MANRPRLIAYREDDLGLTQQEVANWLNTLDPSTAE